MRCGYNQYGLIKIPIKKACSGYFLRWYYNGWHYWFFLPGTLTINTDGEKYRTIGTRKIAMNSGQITRGQSNAIRTIVHTREVYLLTAIGWMNIRIEPGTLNIYDSKITGGELEFVAIIGSRELSLSGYSPIADVPDVPPSTGYCEVVIGTQIWMCKNWDSNWPGSKVYNNDEANRAIYGGLYSFSQINSPGFCPDGWHVPTLSEWDVLRTYLGGNLVAGGHLKEVGISHWDAPNTGATDTYNFAARGAGYHHYIGYFDYLLRQAIFWTGTEDGVDNAKTIILFYNNIFATAYSINKLNSFSVRLIKNTPSTPFDDWFLPSRDELSAMKTQLHDYGVGGFVNGWYWSSSESYYEGAFAQLFTDGTLGNLMKSSTRAVRACRLFTSSVNYNLRDVGPAGGWIFWKSGNNYLEAAPLDLANSTWSNIIGTAIGTTGTAIGTGQANTTAIIGQAGHTDSAAKLCDDLIIYH